MQLHSTSIMREMAYPLGPPMGSMAPPDRTASGSVVGFPWESTPQPRGMDWPFFLARVTLPRATALVAISKVRGRSGSPVGRLTARGLVPSRGVFPPVGGMAGGPLAMARPSIP